jgi:sugar transferase (PEP-CTERM/EpsH1 system associated)
MNDACFTTASPAGLAASGAERGPGAGAPRLRVLYLTHRLPFPPDKGDRIRCYHTLKYLSAGAEVHLACLADEPVPAAALAGLHRYCVRVAAVPVGGPVRWLRGLATLAVGRTVTEGVFASAALAATLRAWGREQRFDVCLASASSLVPYLRLRELRDVPAVVDLVDVDSQKWLDYAAGTRGPRAWLYRTEGRRLRRLEQQLPSWARGIVLTTPVEVALYEEFAGAGKAQVVCNGVDLDYFRPGPPVLEPVCTFVGALDYRPNVEGVSWFARHVWQEVRRRCPAARLLLVGRRPAPAVAELAEVAGIELVGEVPDVRPHLGRAAVALVPLRLARGVQNKLLEALAMGKAVVSSPLCVAGLGVTNGDHLVTATTPAEWADAVLRLFDDSALRGRLGAAGRRYVEDHHRWEACLAPLGELLARAASGPSRTRNVAE